MTETTQQSDTANRVHFYLITDHEDEDKVGLVRQCETRYTKSSKNEKTAFYQFDDEAGEFYPQGKHVSMGYVDFESDDPSEEELLDAIQRKLAEIDERHIEDAGHDVEAVLDE